MVAEAQVVPAAAVAVRFQLLGPVTATNAEGQPIRLGPTKQRGVLACLLLNANTVVSTSRLVTDVWGEDAPPTAIKMIHGSISRLRSALGPAAQLLLVTSGNGYQINVRPEALDVSRCRGLLAAGLDERTTDPHAAVRCFDEALQLFQGPPLGELADLPFSCVAIVDLEDMHRSLVEAKVEAELALGRHAEIIGQARRLADSQPLRERPHSQLMLALYRSGRQVEALHVFTEFRRRLADEEGLDPGRELARLQQRILEQDATLLRPAATSPPQADRVPTRVQDERADDRASTQVPTTPRRRLRAIPYLVTVTGLAGAVAVAGVLLYPHPPAKRAATALPTITVTGNSAVALDAQTGRVVGDYPVGNAPHAIAYGDGMAWTSNIADKTISQVDVAAGRVVKTYGLATAALSLATGPGVVWMTNGFAGSVSRILVGYRQLSAPLLPEPSSAGMSAIAVTSTNLWVTSADRAAVELDPASLRSVATLRLRRQARSITVDGGAVWSTDISRGLVERTSLTTGIPTDIPVQGTGRQVVAGAGSVWVTSEKPNTLSRIDPATGRVVERYPLLDAPTAEAVANGLVWVAEGDNGTLQRFDPSGKVLPTSFTVGHQIGGLAGSGTNVWLTTD